VRGVARGSQSRKLLPPRGRLQFRARSGLVYPAIFASVGTLVLVVVVFAMGLRYSVGAHSVPPFSVGRAPGISAPAGPLLVVMGAKCPRPGLISVRAPAAGQRLYPPDLFAPLPTHGATKDIRECTRRFEKTWRFKQSVVLTAPRSVQLVDFGKRKAVSVKILDTKGASWMTTTR
jgi:hypothetical protein